MGKPIIRAVAAALLMAAFASAPAAAAGIQVFASILPQRYFIDRIAGDRVEVGVMVSPGANPATYEPKPRQMIALSEASAYFAVGVPFERVWLDRIAAANPSMKIVHTDSGIEKVALQSEHGAVPSRNEAHGKSHGIEDPHIWTSPPLVMIQARHILTALIEIAPAHRSEFERNYTDFIRELADLDIELIRLFSGPRGIDRFMVFHPSWGYFARAYGLTQMPIELEGKSPKPAQLQELIEKARQLQVRVIFAQPQFSTESAEIVARAIGGRVVFADPLAADWKAGLRRQAEAFRSAMEQRPWPIR